jgi:hypothetical protein
VDQSGAVSDLDRQEEECGDVMQGAVRKAFAFVEGITRRVFALEEDSAAFGSCGRDSIITLCLWCRKEYVFRDLISFDVLLGGCNPN